jgi:hypothetical protein
MRSFATRQTTRLFSLTLLTLALGLVQAQAKTDFSGTWKLNASKSDFGPMPPPDSMTETITHADPSLKANVKTTGGMQGDLAYDVAYTTDGKECVNHVADNEFKSTLHWDGDELVVETKGTFSGNEFTSKDRWSLSADGKTLSIARHLSSAMGEADMKTVFDKQ